MQAYHDFLAHILANGVDKPDRTGTGIKSVFAYQMRFDLSQGFPLVTTKRTHFKSIAYELLWFLSGNTHIQFLKDNGVSIWDEWADANGHLGPVYGAQWRSWPTRDGRTIDQISQALDLIRRDPTSRRILVSAWNVGELDKMALMPCHVLCQFYVVNQRLSCQVYQRSADAFLGVPFNIASYALLTHLMAAQSRLNVGELIWTGGDCHIYHNHQQQVALQLSRSPYPLPQLKLNPEIESIFAYRYEDIEVLNYQHHPAIPAPVAV